MGWIYGLRTDMQTRKPGVTAHVVNPGILSDGGMAVNHPGATRSAMEEAMKSTGSATTSEIALSH